MLTPLAVIHSVLEPVQTVVQKTPFLEVAAGPSVDSASVDFPEYVLEKCAEVYRGRAGSVKEKGPSTRMAEFVCLAIAGRGL